MISIQAKPSVSSGYSDNVMSTKLKFSKVSFYDRKLKHVSLTKKNQNYSSDKISKLFVKSSSFSDNETLER